MFRKILQFGALGLGLAVLGSTPVRAAYNDVTFSADSVINLSGSGINITVANGGQVAGYTVNTTSIAFNLESGSTVTLRSNDFYRFPNDGGFSTECGGSYSEIVLTSTTTRTVTVTPTTTNPCSGVGGGGGGGSAPVPAPPILPQPTPPAQSLTGTAAHPNGTLILDGTTIYLIRNGQRYGFRDPNEYASHGYSFAQAVVANSADKALPTTTGNIIKALVGTLVLDAADNRTVYMVGEGSTKRGFASAQVFQSLGYSFANLPKINLADYPTGPVITEAAGAHPEGSLVREPNGTVWWILGGQKLGFESFAVLSTYGFPVTRIVPANASDLALPMGPLVKFRDGTIVKSGSDYYIISDGKKLKFASSDALTAKGYNASVAIEASLDSYAAGESI